MKSGRRKQKRKIRYFLILQWLPIGSLGKKAALWCILGVPSIWWIDHEEREAEAEEENTKGGLESEWFNRDWQEWSNARAW
jgi:hypothetical protein